MYNVAAVLNSYSCLKLVVYKSNFKFSLFKGPVMCTSGMLIDNSYLFQKIQDDISQHRAALQDLMELGRGIMNEASSEDFISVSNQLAQLQASYELLQRQLAGKQRLLNDQFVKVGYHNYYVY